MGNRERACSERDQVRAALGSGREPGFQELSGSQGRVIQAARQGRAGASLVGQRTDVSPERGRKALKNLSFVAAGVPLALLAGNEPVLALVQAGVEQSGASVRKGSGSHEGHCQPGRGRGHCGGRVGCQ